MLKNGISSWIKEQKALGFNDKQIGEKLKISGWTDEQVDEALKDAGQKKVEELSQAITGKKPAYRSAKKAWMGVLVIGIIIIVAGGLYLLGTEYGFPWEKDSDKDLPTYVSPTSTSTSLAEQLATQSTMGKFKNYDQLKDFLDDHTSVSSFGYYGDGLSRSFAQEDISFESGLGDTFGLGTADLESAPLASPLSSLDYSATNIQVAGVDEADIIKTDGKYIYAVSKKNVFIINAYPAEEAEILSTIVLSSTPQNIYINDNYLVIHGQEEDISVKPFYDLVRPYSSYTFFKVFDVTDRKNPKQVRDLEFEGSYTNSRMIGDYIYFITAHPATYIDDDSPIPLIVEDGELLPIEPGTARCNCPDIYYIDAPYPYYIYTTVTAINVVDNDKPINNDVYLLGSSENMYVSLNNIYLVYTKHISEYQLSFDVIGELLADQLSAKDKQRIKEIDDTPRYILSPEEKLGKIYFVFMKYIDFYDDEAMDEFEEQMEQKMKEKYADISKELEKTVIHKIEIDKGRLVYRGSGEVTGQVLNQFSMDESGDYFRIATTKNRGWSTFMSMDDSFESYSNVYVLDKDLKVIGALENLAKGERIYSARFMQGRVYLVTFRQMDPLFVIDLSDPKNPKLLGQLKVPGFSSYLHPYDETKLIGFGKQATEEGRVQGLKLSLFDVSDVNNIKEIDTYEMGDSGSDSIALNDHKAFLFSKDKNLLVVPVSLREQQKVGQYGSRYTRGAMVFSITPEGFTFRQRIDHADESEEGSSTYSYGYRYYDNTVRRSLYIDDVLYTLSNKYVKMHGLDDLKEVKSTTLTPGESTDDYSIIH